MELTLVPIVKPDAANFIFGLHRRGFCPHRARESSVLPRYHRHYSAIRALSSATLRSVTDRPLLDWNA
jgi:hypothetical protein